jgi:hypothetical protein
VEIGQYDVEFILRRAIKSQSLTDFIAEWTYSSLRGINDLPDHWVMYFDRSYTLKEVGASVVLIPPEGDMLKYAIQIESPTTNNTTEYEGASHWTLVGQGARHSVTSHLGRLSACSKTSTKGVRLQQ